MITELLARLGGDYREAEGGGVGRFSSIHVLQSRDGFRIANIMGADVLREKSGSNAFTRSLSGTFPTNVLTPEQSGNLSNDVYWISGLIPHHPQSLESRLETARLLTPSEIAEVGGYVCDTLSEIHKQGRLHGGLTPGNIFTGEDDVWLAEAGVQEALQAAGANTVQLSIALQTSYLSPEESSGGATRSSAQSEIFSLGVVLYQLLTGKLPFGGRTTTMVMATVLTNDIVSTTQIDAPSSEESDRVVSAILRAIEKDPADRWSSVDQFAAALRGKSRSRQTAAVSDSRSGCLPNVLLLSGSAGLLQYLFS